MRHTIRHGGCFLGVAGCGVLRDGDHGRAGADQLADQLVDIVEDERFVDRTMIMSMDQRAIGRILERRTGPNGASATACSERSATSTGRLAVLWTLVHPVG